MIILLPLILSLPAYYVLKKVNTFSGLNILEKYLLVLASSISVINILLVYLGQSSGVNIKGFAIAIFVVCTILILLSSKQIVQDVLSVARYVFKNKVYRLLFILLFVLIAKVTLFYFLHPIVDPDIVSQYLTYARSIVLDNHIPALDIFTLNPATTPPIGGPMLFSFYYFITGNLQSEGFRLLTYPFFMGIVALTYLISKRLFGKTWFALLSCIVFLSFPLIDSMLLEWVLYPDIIATFLELTIVYFLFFRKQNTNRNNNLGLYIIMGLSAAEMLLLKSQSVLFFTILLILLLLRAKIFKFNTYLLGSVMAIIILLFPLSNSFGFHLFRLGNIDTISYLLLIIPVIVILFLGYKNKKSVTNISPLSMGLMGIVASTGLVWLVRNHTLFKNFLSAYGSGIYKNMPIQYQVFAKDMAGSTNPTLFQSFNSIALIALPVFGSLFLIPKIIGIITASFNNHWNTVVLFVTFWYALIIIYSGFPNERYLFVIFPFLSALIVYGIKYIDDKTSKKISIEKEKLFGLIAVTLFALFSLSQSIILSWGFGSSLYSASDLRQISNSSNSIVEKFTISPILEIARLLNIRIGTFAVVDLAPSLLIGMGISLMVLIITFVLIKKLSLSKIKIYIVLVSLLLFTPYVVLIFQMSGSNIRGFSKEIELNMYSYWGEANTIVPYFKDHFDPSATTLVIGPQTGISYKIFMKAYNIQYGYGFIEIATMVKEKNPESIYKYFRERNIQYVLVYEGRDNGLALRNFENNSTIYNFIKDQKYFTTEVIPDNNNLWRLYKLKSGV
jgi:hypothetical protein